MGKPKPFDLLAEFGRFGLERKLALTDSETRAAFGLHVAQAVDQALADPALLHGQRAEAMFEAMLSSLSDYRLVKREDGGRIISAEPLRVPDFRIVLTSGEHWLVEVKNIYIDDPYRQRRKVMTREYRQQQEAYASATGADLKLAIFWARWSMWTLVSPGRFANESGDIVVDMLTATRVNELGALGDRMIGTRPPLKLRLFMDPDRTSAIGEDGQVMAVIGRVAMYCGQDEITDPTEQQIAWIFMHHGEWGGSEAVPVVEGDRLVALDFIWEPEERRNEGFEIIGTLSRVFSRYFADSTLRDGSVVQLLAPNRPGWFEPLIKSDRVSKALPLWIFHLKPGSAKDIEAGT